MFPTGLDKHSAWWFFAFLLTTISNLYSLNDNSWDNLGTIYSSVPENKEFGNLNGIFHHVSQLYVNNWKKKEYKKWLAKEMMSQRRFWMRPQEDGFFPKDETYLWRWGGRVHVPKNKLSSSESFKLARRGRTIFRKNYKTITEDSLFYYWTR